MRYSIYFLASVLFCYGVDISPWYAAIFAQHDLRILGDIEPFRAECTEPPSSRMRCKDAFVIPQAALHPSGIRTASVGLGIFISASEIFCSNDRNRRLRFGTKEDPVSALELLKTYQTVDLSVLDCRGDLILTVWGPPEYARSGYIAGPLVLGTTAAVSQVKRLIEFFAVQFNLLLAVTLIFCLIISGVVLRPVIRESDPNLGVNSVWSYSGYWAAFALVKSGLPEILLPAIGGSFFYIRLSNFVSSLAHLTPGFRFAANTPYVGKRLRTFATLLTKPIHSRVRVNALQILMLAIALSPYFGNWLLVMCIFGFVFYLRIGALARRKELVFFSLTFLMETGKFVNFKHMPYGALTLTFASFCILENLSRIIRHGSRITSILNWTQNLPVCENRTDLHLLLKQFGDKFGIRQMTQIEPHPGGECTLFIFTRETEGWKSETIYREQVPNVFLHVLTTREAVWNVHRDSDFARNLRKGLSAKTDVNGEYFTVIPILKDSSPIAAISLTDYPSRYAQNIELERELQIGAHFLSNAISQVIWGQSIVQSDSWYEACARAGREILSWERNSKSNVSLEIALQRSAQIISEATNLGVFLARVNPVTRRYDLRATAGFPAQATRMWHDIEFYALHGNVQGPMPLSISRGKIITVADLAWVMPVLHPLSLSLLEKTGGKSGSAVPIFNPSENTAESANETSVWGVMWLESTQSGKLTPSYEPGLKLIATVVGSLVSKFAFTSKAIEAISGLTRHDIAEKLLRGESVREQENGYLLVGDILGSTRMANDFGTDLWNDVIKQVIPAVELAARPYGLSLQLIIWDSFFFTKASPSPDIHFIDQFIEFSSLLERLIQEVLRQRLPDAGVMPQTGLMRFCLEYGDVTRDIRNGSWTISGITMARVSKLENACKGLPGWFYTTEDLFPAGRDFELLQHRTPPNNVRIASLKSRPPSRKIPDDVLALAIQNVKIKIKTVA